MSDKTGPNHIAIIMDGNRRWAKSKGLPTAAGHSEGYKRFSEIATICREKGIKILTVYSFSTENWKRSEEEIKALMNLLRMAIKKEQVKLAKDNVCVRMIGRIQDLPEDIQKMIRETEEMTKDNQGGIVNVALSYGGRAEIVDAINGIIKKEGPSVHLTDQMVANSLYTAGQPDPDLIIRTGGQQRLSNFLLWQAAYAELYFTDTLWPDFNEAELDKALEYYHEVKRNFGK